MFKLLFILFVIKPITGQRNIGYQYLFVKQSIIHWVVITQIETLHTLSVLIFACIYFCKLKKIVFPENLFLRMASFWKFAFINFNPKDKRLRKRQLNQGMRLIFLSRSMEKQAGHNGKTVVIDWFQKKLN